MPADENSRLPECRTKGQNTDRSAHSQHMQSLAASASVTVTGRGLVGTLSGGGRTLCSSRGLPTHRSPRGGTRAFRAGPIPHACGAALFKQGQRCILGTGTSPRSCSPPSFLLPSCSPLSALGSSGWLSPGPLILCLQPPNHAHSQVPSLCGLYISFSDPIYHNSSRKLSLCPWSSRPFHSRIFCILALCYEYSLHLLALQCDFCLEILLSLKSSQEVVACCPTALGLELCYMFSLFLIANPKCPRFHNRKRRDYPHPLCMQVSLPSSPCLEDFSPSITLTLRHHSWGIPHPH